MIVARLSLGVAASILLGVSVAQADDEARLRRVCVARREVNSITGLSDRHAFVKVSAGRFYLFTMDEKCRGLETARRVSLDASMSRVCGDGESLLSFEEPAVGPMRCRIERIESVADKEAALELIDERAGPR